MSNERQRRLHTFLYKQARPGSSFYRVYQWNPPGTPRRVNTNRLGIVGRVQDQWYCWIFGTWKMTGGEGWGKKRDEACEMAMQERITVEEHERITDHERGDGFSPDAHGDHEDHPHAGSGRSV
jgi:hypothetical protein